MYSKNNTKSLPVNDELAELNKFFKAEDGFMGWTVAIGSHPSVIGRSLVRDYGFELINHRLYPDDPAVIHERLSDDFIVEDATIESARCMGRKVSRSYRLTKKYKI